MTEEEEYYFWTCPFTGQTCYNGFFCGQCEITEELRAEEEAEQCGDDCEHCEWATCPKEVYNESQKL